MTELAVDVGGDRAADGHVAGAGHDHRKPAEGKEHPHEHLDAHARLDRAGSLLRIQLEDAIELGAAHDVAPAVLGGIAVTPTQTTRDDAAPAASARSRGS